MTCAYDFTFAAAPFIAAEITELSFAETCDMIASSLFLDHVATFETLHKIHLAEEFDNLVLISGH
jgi:hypothetical protein